MPKQSAHKEFFLDSIFDLISRFPEGASLEEIMLGLGPVIARRTLQRQLALLVQENQLIAVGKTKARRYKLALVDNKGITQSSLITLSYVGEKIQATVTKPIQKRTPVGYDKEFLKNYVPNETFYLPEKLREKLTSLGKVADEIDFIGTYANHIFNRLLIDLSWNSSRLEGNTYSLLETERLLDSGKAAEGKNLKETQMILNHKAAIEFLLRSPGEMGINRYVILNLHTLLSDNLLPDSAFCGRLRLSPVGIEKSVYHPLQIPQVIEECFDLLLYKVGKIKDPLEQAFFLMVHLPYLQPFEDVNKRTSRLAANIPLIRNRMSPLSFIDLPQDIYINGLLGIYELNQVELLRDVFEWAYERSATLYNITKQTLGEPDPFKLKYRDSIKKIVSKIVLEKLDKADAAKSVSNWVKQYIPETDQKKLIEIVEIELLGLHEGNIARYYITLKEFENWKKNWV